MTKHAREKGPRTGRRFAPALWQALLLCGGLWTLAPVAHAQNLRAVESNVGDLQSELMRLQAEVARPQALDRGIDLARQFVEGQLRYFTGEYDAAAIFFVDIVENRQFRTLAGWNDARWYLADSLFLLRNYGLARSYFDEIIRDDDPQWAADAARRMLEIAMAQGEYEALDQLFEALMNRVGNRATPEIAFVRGKALYFRARMDEAFASFGQVPADDALYERARYFIGVIQTRAARYDEAVTTFEQVATRLQDATRRDLRDLRDLSILAAARVRYEQRDYVQARDTYLRIAPDSDSADEAAYELAWSQIRMEELSEALRTLEILELVATDGRYIPESQLLRADLLMRIGRREDAEALFEQVASTYAPVELELRRMMASRRSDVSWFDILVDPERAGLRLPVEVEPWFRSNESLDRALGLVADRETAQEDIRLCRSVIAEIDAVLSQNGGAGLFPVYRDAWARAVQLQGDSLGQRVALAELEAALLSTSWSGAQADQWSQARAARQEAWDAFRRLPRTFDQIAERSRRSITDLSRGEMDAFRTTQEIQESLAEIQALRRIVQRQVSRGLRTEAQGRAFVSQLGTLERELTEQQSRTDALIESVRLDQVRQQSQPGLTPAEIQVRARMLDAMAREESALQQGRAQAQNLRDELARIDSLRATLVQLDDGGEAVFGSILQAVAETTAQVRTVLEEERAAVERYDTRLAALQDETEAVAGDVAWAAFVDVQQRFSVLTLRANLGVLDVAWQLKEEASDRIRSLQNAQLRELRLLDADFEEILDQE
jgi:TolA-binding protein